MKKFNVYIIALGLLCIPSAMLGAKKQPLKVLYVGGSTDFYEPAPEKLDSLVQARTDAFKNLLSEYFTSVTAINGSQYNAAMSKDYDVTVLDGKPQPIIPQIIERDKNGNVTRYEMAKYLPDDYDCATITIGRTGNDVGRGIGCKNDWYCLCLDAQAHHWVKDHPIFKGPFKVKMTVETCPTPEEATHYAYFYDEKLPDSIPMWSVQTIGYKNNPGFSIGMVARPWGYTDSPETEYISSGVCAKTIDAVAIGRHGNFLHWGFASSPIYMTDEAKTVFANAVAYIAKFNGQKILARKFNDRIATREYLKEVAYLVSREAYEDRIISDSIWNENQRANYQNLLKRKESGESLTDREKSLLNNGDPGEYKPQPYENYLKRYAKGFYEMFGTDDKAYAKYFKDNLNYFYSEGFYNIFIDEDVKAWGINNHDHRLLDKAISSLENGTEIERANRILARYTMADFKTPAEWRKWYDTYKDRMFFTESGGWKFLIDGDDSIPGNNYFEYRKRVEQQQQASSGDKTSDQNPVVTSVKLKKDNSDNLSLVVNFKIHPGYHIYANVSDEDPYKTTEIALNLPEGVTAGDWKFTHPGRYGDSGTTIHEDEAEYSCPITGNGRGAINCTISYQCCDTHICMPPVKQNLKVIL